MLEVVVVVGEGLPGVERRVDVDEPDPAGVALGQLGDAVQGGERVERVALDEQIAGVRRVVADGADFLEETHFADAGVGGFDPLVASLGVRDQPQVLVRPRQLQAAARLQPSPLLVRQSPDCTALP
ncbi:MAG TPA: hypothetical protein VIR58_03555 [Acidimicrobiales bacterium]